MVRAERDSEWRAMILMGEWINEQTTKMERTFFFSLPIVTHVLSQKKKCGFFFVLNWCAWIVSPCCQGEGTLIVNGGNSVFQLKQQIFISFTYFRSFLYNFYLVLRPFLRVERVERPDCALTWLPTVWRELSLVVWRYMCQKVPCTISFSFGNFFLSNLVQTSNLVPINYFRFLLFSVKFVNFCIYIFCIKI